MVKEGLPNVQEIFSAHHTWHLGYDLFVIILCVLILSHVFLYSYRIYQLSYRKTHLLFSLAFLLFTIKYVLVFLGRYIFYSIQFQGMRPPIDATTFNLLYGILSYCFIVVTIGALLCLLYSMFKITNIWTIIITTMLVYSAVFFTPQIITSVILMQALILAILTGKALFMAYKKPKASTLWSALGISLLFLGIIDYFAPWSFHFTFTADIVFAMIGFSSIFLGIRQARIQATHNVKKER